MTPRTTARPTIVRITSAPALPADGALPFAVPAEATPGSSGVRSSWNAGACFLAWAAACLATAAFAAVFCGPVAADARAGWSNAIAAHAATIRRMLVRTGGSRRESKAISTSAARLPALSVRVAAATESPIAPRGYSKMGRATCAGTADTDGVRPRAPPGTRLRFTSFPAPPSVSTCPSGGLLCGSNAASSSSRPTAGTAEALWRAWIQNKDVAARDRLVLSYAPMVKYLACRKVRELPAHCELDDLVSCGLLALIAAVDRFDPAKGATFEQYAWTRVSGAIMDELRRQDWAPRSLRRSGRAIERAREEWQSRTGRAPSDQELARELEITVDDLNEQLSGMSRADVLS